MDVIHVLTSSKNYPVYLGSDILENLKDHLTGYSKLWIVTNTDLKERHLDTLTNHLPNIETHIYIAPNGEKAKTFEIYQDCISFGMNHGMDRHSVVLAFGGGAIGDLAGFVAASYMRGIAFIQIPTTILAHDSAVGGKVGINHPLGKNMVGAFKQPELVIYDTQFLATLSIREKRSGFAEIIKHAFISDPQFLQELMNETKSLEDLAAIPLQKFLKKGIETKANIVKQDETENDIRAYLNFGHTLGHALEAAAGFGELTHGEAVMMGIVYALNLSKQIYPFAFPYESFISWLEGLGYRWKIPANCTFESILEWMVRDKKSVGNEPVFVLLQDIGRPIRQKVNQELLRKTLLDLQDKKKE
ncbi:3-dehydroquinate synthase [Bacillus sp. APMAM]|nr:3-dehydroquinate synthase [Bacillus sp. APMAM]RTZ53335.1 3-dehydroquinate synthase [Bacillus sp. SAJ1]